MLKKTLLLIMALLTVTASFAAKKQTVVASTIQLSAQEMLYNEGTALMKAGDYDGAIYKFTSAIDADSTFINAYNNRAIAYFNADKPAKALEDLETVEKLDTAGVNVANIILKAKIYYGIGFAQKAEDELNRALETAPENTNALLDKAALLQATGNYELAMAAYTTYNYKTGGTAASFNELGNCYDKVGDIRVANECYRKAYAADSTDNTVIFNLAKSEWEFYNDTLKAIALVDGLIQKDSTKADYYNLKGYISYQIGDTITADKNFDLAILNNQNLASAHLGKGLIKMASGNYSEAITHFSNAINANINYGEAYLNRGIAKEAIERFDGACEDFHQAMELGTENANEYYKKQCE